MDGRPNRRNKAAFFPELNPPVYCGRPRAKFLKLSQKKGERPWERGWIPTRTPVILVCHQPYAPTIRKLA